MKPFKFTAKQAEAQAVCASQATHIMLEGGSRSGKTFLLTRNLTFRALKAPVSRHAILRFRFNQVKTAVLLDTFPKVMKECFPGVEYEIDKTDWYARFDNESEIWFSGLDDKDRTEKVLGKEFATIYLNECSQIPYRSMNMAVTRLAQKVMTNIEGREPKELPPRMYYDLNPPSKAHWGYKIFHLKQDPDTGKPLARPADYVTFKLNPDDNLENLTANYLETLEGLSPRMRKRFRDGDWAEATPNALFSDEIVERYRVIDGTVPDMIRIVVSVDPSGADSTNNTDNDAIGIMVVGLGTDGCAYVLEDATVKAGPKVWGRVATDCYDRHNADIIVGEHNYGGAMVKFTIQVAKPRVPYKEVHASRGKAVRAEPISALYDSGKVRHVGYFSELEDELYSFSTSGYLGEDSPNRADALIWAISELFSGLVNPRRDTSNLIPGGFHGGDSAGWMG